MIIIKNIDCSDVKVSTLGPSTFTSLLKGCRYQYMLQHTSNKGKNSTLPSAKSSSLGTIVHSLFEERTKGSIPDAASFENRWEELVAKEERRIKDAYGLKEYSLCDYDKMYSAMDTALSLDTWSSSAPGSISSTSAGISIESEKKYQTDNLVGKIDRVEEVAGKITIIDYKTGKVTDEDGNIKEEYETQLNLYAYMYQATKGVKVDELQIMDIGGTRYQVNVWDSAKIAVVLAEVDVLIKAMNDAPGDKSTLASPSDKCAICSAKMICNAYWVSPYRVAADEDDPQVVFEDMEISITKILGINGDVAEYMGGRIKGLSRFSFTLEAGKTYRIRGLIKVGEGFAFGALYSTCGNTIIMELE